MTKILGYNIFSKDMKEVLKEIKNYKKVHIISGNPEVLQNGLNNEELFNNFTSNNSIIIPDGIGVVIASKLIKQPVTEKIAGIELMDEILKQCAKEEKEVYFLGTKKEVLEEAEKKLTLKYKGLKIVGKHDGYFNMEDCDDIVADIINKKPYALFVAMGCPRQEIFITKYMDKIPCKIFMGVGGSIDVFAGKVKRAPKWMIKLGLEWLYRVIKEPFRIKRLAVIPKFIFKVVKNKDRI